MTTKKDYFLPHQDLLALVPQNLRNPMISSLIDNLFNRFFTKDEAVPLYGYVGRKPASPDDRSPKVSQPTPERDVNALIPVLSFSVGSETYSFTVQDLIRKAEVLGISTDQSSWLYSQGNNYLPPIDIDRFTNFFNYYWIADALPTTPTLSWNPTLAPEYYAITPPTPTDPDKLNVVAATAHSIVLTGSGFYSQIWTVEFSSDVDFTVTASGAGIPDAQLVQTFMLPAVVAEGTSVYEVQYVIDGTVLLSFNVVRDPIYDGGGAWVGNESFAAGDQFTINAPFLTTSYQLTQTVGAGIKGKLSGISSYHNYQIIDGVQLKLNDRVLVKNQGSSDENGIYIVQPGDLVRAADFNGSTASAGARVFVLNGIVNASTLWEASGHWVWSKQVDVTTSNTNDWQETNYWVHSSEVEARGADIARAIQAVRPIVQFNAGVVLNTHFQNGLPLDTGKKYLQRKTEFNQAPLFDLYRYDGSHSQKVSTLFFYVEDSTAEIDVALQRRTKLANNGSSDFIFAHGMLDDDGSLLFYKTADDSLHTVWHKGYTSPEYIDQEFIGVGNGVLTVNLTGIDPFIAQQIWTLTAVSPTEFKVVGSKCHTLPAPYDIITIDTPYQNGMFNAAISSGGTAFVKNDKFTFRVANLETTRYVYRDSTEALYDFFGGQEGDNAGVGAWQVPRMFYTNVAASNGGEIPEGTMYSHFRGILANQLKTTPPNYAFGGSIKLWSEQQNLLAALLMQRDLTPISMIDMAQRQYETSLNSMVDLYMREFVNYVSNVDVMVTDSDTSALLDYLLAIRAMDTEVRTVLFDSTASVVGFPATLPMLGVTPLIQPGVVFDNELGSTLMQYHDGHLAPMFVFTQTFRDQLLSPGLLVKRSDGSYTPAVGSFNHAPPAQPYRGGLWIYPNETVNELRIYNVISDSIVAPNTTVAGDYWYSRGTDSLFIWSGTDWNPVVDTTAPWVTVDPAAVLNDMILQIEQRLYNGVNQEQRTYFSSTDVANAMSGQLAPQLQRELATFAASNNYDPTAPDYVSTDPFTWNYSGLGTGDFAPVNTSSVPARWYKALYAHQATVPGVLATSRPNLEPWLLVGESTKPLDWDSLYQASVTPDMVDSTYLLGNYVKVVHRAEIPQNTPLLGTPIIDDVQLAVGDLVLLTSEVSAKNNGIWIIQVGSWQRASIALVQKLVLTVQQGTIYQGTSWVLLADVVNVNVDPVPIEQIKLWKDEMWEMISTERPALKLSVDTVRDALLPPYVNAGFPYGVNSLTNSLPPTPAAPYEFGEGSPVETVWLKSIEYRYSLARSLFRADPLAFLGWCWGFEWIEMDGVLYDRWNVSVPGHPKFRLHGDPIQSIDRSMLPKQSLTVLSVSGPVQVDITIKHDGYTADHLQSFSVKVSDGTLLGYAQEGVMTSIAAHGYTITNLLIEDSGRAYRVGDAFKITADASGANSLVTFISADYVQVLGFGQIFANALRASSVDTSQGYAIAAYKGWDVNLGYRAGGLVSTDDLHVFTENETLPESSFSLRFKRSPYAKDLWVQGLRVTVTQYGASTLNANGFTIPSADASDWVFRIQGYNSRHLGLQYYTFTSDDLVSFNALSKAHTSLAWYQPTQISDTLSAQLPVTITGLQNVVNFLFGYSHYLTDQGWVFGDENEPTIDAQTGRVLNWQLEIEKLIDVVYAGIELGQGHVLVPFMDKIWLDQDTGLLSQYYDTALFDVTGHPGVFDMLGVKIHTNDLTVLRRRGKSQISANVPMFTVHAQVDEYEHLFVFNNLSSPSTNSGLIYDPFSGARLGTIKFNGRRQATQTLRPEFGGHYLVGDQVLQNIQAASDKVSRYYDADHVFEDELSTLHALSLLGFSTKQYMADLDLTDRTQFNFWRGLIQMKGTNASVDAFLNNDRFQDATVDEYWAYKVAEYGDSRTKLYPELKLSVNDTLQQFTKLQFDGTDQLATFTQISSDDETRWFSIDDLDGETSFEARIIGSYENTISVGGTVVTLPFIADKLVITGTSTVTQVNGSTLLVTVPGTLTVTGYGPSTPKFNPIKLFNYTAEELIEDISLWHPAMGLHTPAALDSLNIISALDPARYNVSTQVTGNPNYDPFHAWGAKEVGRVWWDTTNLEYVPYADQTIYSLDERLARWGKLTDYGSVDVVEWVESSVTPTEYNAQAAIDSGNADLDPNTKADGEAYNAKTYVRNRVWAVRPIAWSRAGVPDVNAHIGGVIGRRGAFAADSNSALIGLNSGLARLSSGTFTAAGVSAGMRIGAFEDSPSQLRAVSESSILSLTKYIGFDVSTPFAKRTSVTDTSGLIVDVDMTVVDYTAATGQLSFTGNYVLPTAVPVTDSSGVFLRNDVLTYVTCSVPLTNFTDTVLVRNDPGLPGNTTGPTYGATFTTFVGQAFTFTLVGLGLKLTITAKNAGTWATNSLSRVIVAALGATYDMFDAAEVQTVVPPMGLADASYLSNDYTDPLNPNADISGEGGIGWRAWSVPTQAQLTADSQYPNSEWYPMAGSFTETSVTIAQVQDAATSPSILLNNGSSIERYQTTWDDWAELTQTLIRTVCTSAGAVVITLPSNTTLDRVSVYVNGVAQLVGTYSLSGATLTITTVAVGAEIVVIVRPYSPSQTELNFNPEVFENLLIQQQYKIDYQYVAVPVRDSDGNITSTKYYFWVKNRSIAAHKKNFSVKSIAQLLFDGPSNYLTFQHMIGDGSASDPFRYDAITVSGLSYVVTKDDTFKLRFTRNFTLRDDDEEMDLKDTHVEWTLIRAGQRTKIPEALWQKMTDTACAQDGAGNTLPSPRRVAYDARNGTGTRYGFGVDQVLADSELVLKTLLFTILNTSLTDKTGTVPVPDYMTFLDFSQSDTWFSTPASTRNTLTRIWNEAKIPQINELFFAVLNDICAANYTMTDIFKTSRLSAYSIKIVNPSSTAITYE
jgi:hypothetical protein